MDQGKETLTNQYISKFLGFLFLIVVFSGLTLAQQTTEITPTPRPAAKIKPFPKPKCKDCPETLPETPGAEMPEAPNREISPTPDWKEKNKFGDDFTTEKSIEVDNGVQIDLSVCEGNIKINGWDRNEIRVFINHGSKAGFRTFGKNDDGKPTKVTILGYDPAKDKGKEVTQCISGEEIQLDVPNQSSLSKLIGTAGKVSVTIESIAKATLVKINQGDILLRDISEGIVAKTYDGNISVEDSNGVIDLDATNGRILVYNVEPLEEGDTLKVKTNSGSLIVQSSTHSVIEATSVSGLIKFTGEIQTDGQYTFRNTNGQILLGIPKETSCQVEINAQKDRFSSDIPLKVITVNDYPPSMRRTLGTFGEGEAIIKLINQNGRITIKKTY
jgi:hypothetical protein